MTFTDFEMFVLLWIFSAIGLMFLLTVCTGIAQAVEYYSKSPSQRATDWVNNQIEKDRNK